MPYFSQDRVESYVYILVRVLIASCPNHQFVLLPSRPTPVYLCVHFVFPCHLFVFYVFWASARRITQSAWAWAFDAVQIMMLKVSPRKGGGPSQDPGKPKPHTWRRGCRHRNNISKNEFHWVGERKELRGWGKWESAKSVSIAFGGGSGIGDSGLGAVEWDVPC